MNESEIHELLFKLSRSHPSGGRVIERAAVMAAGSDSPQVLAWIADHDGQPEELTAPAAGGGGLHGTRFTGSAAKSSRTPLRYVLKAGVLD